MEAYSEDPLAGTEARVYEWVRRTSWGHHTDFCSLRGSRTTPATRADCAKEIGTSPQRVHEAIGALRDRNYLYLRGKIIYPVVDPAGEAPPPDPGSESKNSPYLRFLDEWREEDPTGFQTSQDEIETLRQDLKARRQQILQRFKEWQKIRAPRISEANLSALHGKNVSRSPEESSAAPRRNGGASLYETQTLNSSAAAAFPTQVEAAPAAEQNPPPPPTSPYVLPPQEKAIGKVSAALAQFEPPDRETVLELIQACSEADPEATADEIVVLIESKGRRWRGPGLGFFLRFVPPCFPFNRTAPIEAEPPPGQSETEWRAEQYAKLADPEISEEEKHVVRLCLGEGAKGVGS